MTNNNLIIILCHCDTKIKKKILLENIKCLKAKGFDVMVLSHIPISQTLQNKIEYYIYDKSNPIIHYPYRGMVFWKTLNFKNNPIKLQNIVGDYGWTAFNQILLAGNLGISLDYEYFSFINYDIKMNDLILESLLNPVPFLTSKVNGLQDKKNRFPGFMLNILSKSNLKKILPLIDKEFYMCDEHSFKEDGKFKDAEDYWGHLIRNFKYKIFPEAIEDKISYESYDIDGNPKGPFNFIPGSLFHTHFKIFFQNSNTFKKIITDNWTPRIIIYDNKLPKLTLVVNSLETQISGNPNLCLDLPDVVDKIGYIIDGEYTDLTDEYHKAIFSTINFV